MCREEAEIQALTQFLRTGNAGNAQSEKVLRRILQDPINIASRVASFVLELVQDQPPELAQESTCFLSTPTS